MTILTIIRRYILSDKVSTFFLILLSFITLGISVVLPHITGIFIDNLKMSESYYIFQNCKIFLLLCVTEIIFIFIQNLITSKVTANSGFLMNYDILDHIKHVNISFFSSKDNSYLISRTISDSNTVVNFIIINCLQLALKIICFVGVSYYIIDIYYPAYLVVIIVIFTNLIVYYIFRSKLYSLNYKLKECQSFLFSIMNEQLNSIKSIKYNSWFNVFNRKLRNSYKIYYKSFIDYMKNLLLYQNFSVLYKRIANVTFLFFGGFAVIKGSISIGNFIALNTYLMLLLEYIGIFQGFGSSYQDFKVSRNRIIELLNLPLEHNGTIVINDISEIRLDKISYAINDRVIFNSFSYTFNKGYIYNVVGNNGSGKTTFINLISGLIDKYDGKVLFDSIDLKEINICDAKKNLFSVLEQDFKLFYDSIDGNLTFFNPSLSRQKIYEYCKLLSIGRLLEGRNQSEEYNYNNLLSGGERQKLCIVRTLLKQSKLVIFDEPTSALDKNSTEIFKSMLNEIKRDKIIIIITHDHTLDDICDCTIRLQ